MKQHSRRFGRQLGSAVLYGLVTSGMASAQIREIPTEGLDDIPQDAINFAPEHDFRRENDIGQSMPAPSGTRPGSSDPRNLEGVWINGRTYTINADGSYALTGNTLAGLRAAAARAGGAPPQTSGGAPPGAPGRGASAPGGPPGGGGVGTMSCVPGAPFTVGMPGRILQTADAIYVFKNGGGASTRRIALTGQLPVNPEPRYGGYSLGRWEGEWLVVETVGLKGSMSFGPMMGGGGGSFTGASRVVERIRKIENNLQMESIVTVSDPSLRTPMVRRITSYYRPDLKVVEAPCEEYSDPFEGQYLNSPGRGGAAPAAEAAR